MKTKAFIIMLIAILLTLFTSTMAIALDDPSPVEESFSLYGYLVNYLNVMDGDFGDEIYLRMKGEWKPNENLLFHMEFSNAFKMGNLNPYALFGGIGLSPVDQNQYPLTDFNQELKLDHYWASATIKQFNIQFGKIPLAWGTAYVFNPTSKASLPPFLDMVTEETPGTPAIIPSYTLNEQYSILGYVAFQEKLAKNTAFISDGKSENIPYGLKLQSASGKFDWSVSWIKEVLYVNGAYQKNHYLGADWVGAIGNVGVYGEMALNLPRNAADTAFEFGDNDLKDLIEISLGGDYSISEMNLTTRFELHHQGKGEADILNYNFMRLLTGELPMLAEDYLFLAAEKEFSDYYKLTIATILNLNDGSYVFYPEFSYAPYLDCIIATGVLLFGGSQGSEFNGTYTMGGIGYEIIKPTFYVKGKLSF